MRFMIGMVVLLFIIIIYTRKPLSIDEMKHLPPSPRRLPIVGNMHLVLLKRKVHLPLLFARLCDQLGSVFTFWLGKSPIVVVNNYDTAKVILHAKECSGRPQRYTGNVYSRGFKGMYRYVSRFYSSFYVSK